MQENIFGRHNAGIGRIEHTLHVLLLSLRGSVHEHGGKCAHNLGRILVLGARFAAAALREIRYLRNVVGRRKYKGPTADKVGATRATLGPRVVGKQDVLTDEIVVRVAEFREQQVDRVQTLEQEGSPFPQMQPRSVRQITVRVLLNALDTISMLSHVHGGEKVPAIRECIPDPTHAP